LNAKVPSALVFLIQGLVVLSVVAFGVYRYASREKEE
jgi:ABC-type uncharacterized transport system permease subunit